MSRVAVVYTSPRSQYARALAKGFKQELTSQCRASLSSGSHYVIEASNAKYGKRQSFLETQISIYVEYLTVNLHHAVSPVHAAAAGVA